MEIKFSTDNAAFSDDKSIECKRILEKIIKQIEDDYMCGSILDINGNKIGEWDLDK